MRKRSKIYKSEFKYYNLNIKIVYLYNELLYMWTC